METYKLIGPEPMIPMVFVNCCSYGFKVSTNLFKSTVWMTFSGTTCFTSNFHNGFSTTNSKLNLILPQSPEKLDGSLLSKLYVKWYVVVPLSNVNGRPEKNIVLIKSNM